MWYPVYTPRPKGTRRGSGYQAQGSPEGDWLVTFSEFSQNGSQGDKCSNFTLVRLSFQSPLSGLYIDQTPQKPKGKEACWCNSGWSASGERKQERRRRNLEGQMEDFQHDHQGSKHGRGRGLSAIKGQGRREWTAKETGDSWHRSTPWKYWPTTKPSLSTLRKPCFDLTNPDLVPTSLYHILKKKKVSACCFYFLLLLLNFSWIKLHSKELLRFSLNPNFSVRILAHSYMWQCTPSTVFIPPFYPFIFQCLVSPHVRAM